MKKLFFIAIITFGFACFLPIQSQQFSMSLDGSSGTICKWKIYSCPGWGAGTYEACLDNGDGNECECGTTTRSC